MVVIKIQTYVFIINKWFCFRIHICKFFIKFRISNRIDFSSTQRGSKFYISSNINVRNFYYLSMYCIFFLFFLSSYFFICFSAVAWDGGLVGRLKIGWPFAWFVFLFVGWLVDLLVGYWIGCLICAFIGQIGWMVGLVEVCFCLFCLFACQSGG